MDYKPEPVNTSGVDLDPGITELTEKLAKNTHDVWAKERLAQGWKYGPHRDDARKEHPLLVAYEDLPEAEKIYDRNTAIQALKAITAFGYRISKA